jgi:hypothetical protein
MFLFNKDEEKKTKLESATSTGKSKGKHKGKDKKTLAKSDLHYNEAELILEEFKRIKTKKKILKALAKASSSAKKINGNNFEYSYVYPYKKFIKESFALVKKTHPKCAMPPFQQYYSSFEHMNAKQKNWYLYWRDQVLQGEFLPTDLSYIYVFVYELINYSFNQNAAFNLSMLCRLYDAYKNHHHIERFKGLIGDMLFELGEKELAQKWSPHKPQYPTLYRHLLGNSSDLTRVSITSWKNYYSNHRPTDFFVLNKNKIYKAFKECIHFLEHYHLKQSNQKLIDIFFEKREEKHRRYLYPGMISFRNYSTFVEYDVVNIYPTQTLYTEITTYFKLAENVTRLLNNEKNLLKIDKSILPEELKDQMIQHLSRHKERGRFKTVKIRNTSSRGSAIPNQPVEHRIPKKEEHLPFRLKTPTAPIQRPVVTIEFDDERILQLKTETAELVAEVEKRTQENQLDELVSEEVLNNTSSTSEPLKTQIEKTFIPTLSLTQFFTGSSDDIDEVQLEEMVHSLSSLEKEFLTHFSNRVWSKKEATSFLKTKGQLFGVILSSINEKAQDILEDNLIEVDDNGELTIYEEFIAILNLIKEQCYEN